MRPPIPRLEDYGLSPVHGFLPSETPLDRLPNAYYSPWEAVIGNLQGLLLSKRLHRVIDGLPILSTDYLTDEPEWRRAYMVLAFLSHAYIWGGDTPRDIVSPPISIPFLSTCTHLSLPPVATYAGLALWNYKPLFPAEPLSLSNLMTLHTFTGSLDESWFYLISVAIEARAAPLLPLMLDAMNAVRRDDAATVTECLRGFAECIDGLGGVLERMYENCDAHVFYHRIRPFLAGGKDMGGAGLPDGVCFDRGDGERRWVKFAGGSNAQSSIIQFCDLVLGVEHRPTGVAGPSASPASASPPPSSHSSSTYTAPTGTSSENNFIHQMRTYMPGPHRAFLEAVSRASNIRAYVSARRASDRGLCIAYDACLAMLRAFRDRHIQMVSRYIIIKSREAVSSAPSTSIPTSNSSSGPSAIPAVGGVAQQRKLNIATASSSASSTATGPEHVRKNLRGTGGTALIPFLKQARDETGEPAIDAWARRLLNDGPGRSTASSSSWRGKSGGWSRKGYEVKAEREIVGLAGLWSVDDSEGGICHW